MPNNITNRLEISADAELKKQILIHLKNGREDVHIDFNTIKQMPDGLSVEAHSGIF